MTIVCPACHAEHRVSVVQHSYRELPCKRCGRPIPIGDQTPSPALEPLADFEETGPANAAAPAAAPAQPAPPLAPHPAILAAMAAASPFATATAPPEGWTDSASAPPIAPTASPAPAAPDADTIACPTCGAHYSRSLAVCPLCEAPPDRPLPADPRCPSCSGAIALADRHCRHCGGTLQPEAARGGSWRWLALAGAIALAAAIGFWAARFLLGR